MTCRQRLSDGPVGLTGAGELESFVQFASE
jgi:hypothetical protein